MIKPKDSPFVLNKFNSFDKNLKFTVDNFENGKIHFLDLEISDSGIDIFRKSTHTGQYTVLTVSSLGHAKRRGLVVGDTGDIDFDTIPVIFSSIPMFRYDIRYRYCKL